MYQWNVRGERLLKPISVGTSVCVFHYILSCGIKGLRKFKEKYPLYLASRFLMLGSGHENYSHVVHDSKVQTVWTLAIVSPKRLGRRRAGRALLPVYVGLL